MIRYSKPPITLLITLCLIFLHARALNETRMNAHLAAGAGLLGTFRDSTSWNLSNWMSAYDDSTPVQALSIPGTHDSLTWNVPAYVAPFVKTQDFPFFDQLNYGVRFVDLRIGILKGRIRMYHASYLLDSTAQLEDIFWGLYHWLDSHPTESVLVCIKVDNGNNTAALQRQVYDLITSPETSDYWVWNTTLPLLGQARRKLIPILRLVLSPDNIPDYRPVGVSVARGWRDNYPNITLTYYESTDGYGNTHSQQLFIEDLYNPQAEDEEAGVEDKFEALKTHLDLAAATAATPDFQTSWFIGFASGYNGLLTTPSELALGSTIPYTIIGVNPRVLEYLISKRGQYFGVIMFDYYGANLSLANATLGWDLVSGTSNVRSHTVVLSIVLVFNNDNILKDS